MATTLQKLKTLHPTAGCIIAGDCNDLLVGQITALDPAFRHIVANPTRKDKILHISVTDLHSYYEVPLIIPPVQLDDGALGVPSDHSGVFVCPLRHININPFLTLL